MVLEDTLRHIDSDDRDSEKGGDEDYAEASSLREAELNCHSLSDSPPSSPPPPLPVPNGNHEQEMFEEPVEEPQMVSLISLYSKLIKSKREKRKSLNYLKHVYCILLYTHILKILLPR
uniref:Uncharacterized protein n=1 Tax=Cacopsylla melanoneura TaxID=428564 RepID=A0A8D9F4K6_9HEMI